MIQNNFQSLKKKDLTQNGKLKSKLLQKINYYLEKYQNNDLTHQFLCQCVE